MQLDVGKILEGKVTGITDVYKRQPVTIILDTDELIVK